MKRKLTSLLLAFVMLLTLCPSAFAQDSGLLTLTIEYYIRDTETKIAPTYKASLPADSRYAVDSPAVAGYKVADDSRQTVSGTLEQDTAVRVDYVPANDKAGYTVNYIGRSIDGTEERELDSNSGTAAVGTIITAEDKTFSGYVRDPGTLNLLITADGNAVLNVFYTETVNPCIVFSTGGDYVEPITAEAGTDISSEADDRNGQNPTRAGYLFEGWDWNGDGVYDSSDTPPETMPENDLVVKAVWTPGTSEYIVEYYFQDAEGDDYTRNDGMDEVRQAATESTVTVTDADKEKGETTDQDDPFFGFDYARCEDTTVTGDGQAILKLYYDREIWSIKLHTTPMSDKITYAEYRDEILPQQNSDIWLTFEGRYGAPLPDDFPTVDELTEYYDPLCPEEWKDVEVNNKIVDYFYVNMLWPAQSTWSKNEDDESIKEDGSISNYHYYTNQKFDLEDTPGSREINLYPCYASGSNVFQIDYYLQDLDDQDSYTLVRERIEVLKYQDATFNITDDIEGFTIVGGSYRSKKAADEWPAGESGEPLYEKSYPNGNWPTGYWTEVEANYNDTGTVKLLTKILTDTELRFLRRQFNLYFYSDNKLIEDQTVSGIYYEAPLADYLNYQPSEELANGRTFLGWCLSTGDELPDGTIEMVDEDMTMPAANVYLHAVWAEPQYTVTFDSRGGTPVDSQTVEKGTTAFEPAPPTKDGCTFIGWYDENGVRWSFDQEITEDITLYAVWRQEGEASYTVKHIVKGEDTPFHTDSGTGKLGDTVTDRALGMGDTVYTDYMEEHEGEIYMLPDANVKSLTLKEGDDNVIIFYYSPSPARDYTVHYYLEGTTTPVAPDKNVTGTDYTVVTEEAKDISGYELITDGLTDGKYQTVELVVGENNEIIFYYKLKEDTAVIAPAPVTIYMGGTGYDGAIDEEGGGLTSSNGFPVPGFTISAPEGVNDFDPTKAILKYTNGEDIRVWNIVPYDNDENATHGIYRFEPTGESSATAVRMQFIKADGTVVTEDDFVITDHLDQDLTMEVYGDSIDHGYVTLEYGGKSYAVAAGTAQLKVRSTTSQVQYGSIVETEADVEAGKSGIVAPDDTIYYINNNPVKVVNTSAVKLLFDDIIDSYIDPGKPTNTELLEKKTDEVLESAIAEAENFPLTGKGTRHYELKYLDLVDTSNGNVWVAADNSQGYITVYWPLPEGTDSSTGFALLHFPGLHREMGTDEVADDIDQCDVEIKDIEVTETHIKFDVPRAGFSPFVLVWETEDSGTDPDPDPNPDPNPDPDPDPGKPLEPSNPSPDPDNPGTTTDPDNPGTTTDPDNPGTTPDPDNPGTTTDPDNPDTTSDPDHPDTSSTPGNSGVSTSPSEPASSGSATDPGVPKTGDESALLLWLTLAGAALLGLSGTLLISRRRQS